MIVKLGSSCGVAGGVAMSSYMNGPRQIMFAVVFGAALAVGAEEPSAPLRLPDALQAAQENELPSWLQPGNSPGVTLPIAATVDETGDVGVTRIPAFDPGHRTGDRIVRYEVPLTDREAHAEFTARGIPGRLMSIEKDDANERSVRERLRGFFDPEARRREADMIQVVRYEVPAEEIAFHAQLQSIDGTRLEGHIMEPGMLRMPEVRFFQPKARVFMDLKDENDDEFDLFADGAILASLDVVELYFPMPLISDRFGELLGTPSQLSDIGWRVGGTVGLGIATALNNGTENGRAPVTTLSSGIRYEFPLGRPSREVLDTGDLRLDQRTRVGIELGVQAGVSTRESLTDKTDVGMYFGFQVDTPWGG